MDWTNDIIAERLVFQRSFRDASKKAGRYSDHCPTFVRNLPVASDKLGRAQLARLIQNVK